MSQKVSVRRVRVYGAVYLGEHADNSGTSTPRLSTDAGQVMNWLCDGSRARFNQHRSTRSRYVATDGELIPSAVPGMVLASLGRTVTDITDSQARAQFSYLAAMPAYVLQAQAKLEAQDWFAAAKRRKTNRARGRSGESMPRFRSGKHTDQTFACWRNGTAPNAVLVKTGRRSGTVTITGMNPTGKKAPGHGARWRLVIHVRLSQPIRDYTSVRVNWTRRKLVFVNAPLAITGRKLTGEARGYDRGVAHALADSTGAFLDAPDTTELVKARKHHQRKMAKSRLIAGRQGRMFWQSNRYQAHKSAAATAQAKTARILNDWRQQTSTQIVRDCDLVAFEDLRLASMTRRAKGTGAAQKRGLNRALLTTGLGALAALVEQKMTRCGGTYVAVNPAYTSQRCHQCGHTSKDNRESQAVFRCQQCGHTDNADTNAAKNILSDGLDTWARTMADAGSKHETDNRPGGSTALARTAAAMNRQPLASA